MVCFRTMFMLSIEQGLRPFRVMAHVKLFHRSWLPNQCWSNHQNLPIIFAELSVFGKFCYCCLINVNLKRLVLLIETLLLSCLSTFYIYQNDYKCTGKNEKIYIFFSPILLSVVSKIQQKLSNIPRTIQKKRHPNLLKIVFCVFFPYLGCRYVSRSFYRKNQGLLCCHQDHSYQIGTRRGM